jgi:UDP-N-acetylmuramoyl-L-alanyl-D-glutamate--2,6-diaminopimelate ligase
VKLQDLARDLNLPPPHLHLPPENPDVTSVTHNAEWVTPGSLFVTIRGAKFDGHSFLSEVKDKGAVAALGEGLPEGLTSLTLMPRARSSSCPSR